MNIEVLTLFPEMFNSVRSSMLGKAIERGLLSLQTTDIRDFTQDKHNKTDDYPFGGGAGMVMMADPVFRALESLDAEKKRILYMSPKGSLLCKTKLEELAEEKELVMICGHYEGIDERIIEYWHAEEISIGDYILTGGEPADHAFADRLLARGPESGAERGADPLHQGRGHGASAGCFFGFLGYRLFHCLRDRGADAARRQEPHPGAPLSLPPHRDGADRTAGAAHSR